MADILTGENLIAFLTLAGLEIVLGIDNVIFIAILVAKLPQNLREKATKVGLGAAMVMRILLLLCISWIMKLTKPLFTMPILGHETSGKDIVLLVGGLFLLAKATFEIHEKLEAPVHEPGKDPNKGKATFGAIIFQIMMIDIVFSLDSVITAVGMASHVAIMIAAVIVSVFVMMIFASRIGAFVEKHPTIKMLALSFLLMIGMMLVGEGLGKHIEKGYIYFAMAFSLAVEFLNMKMRKHSQPVQLHGAAAAQNLEASKG